MKMIAEHCRQYEIMPEVSGQSTDPGSMRALPIHHPPQMSKFRGHKTEIKNRKISS
jgi:hypothetical protein